MQRTYSGRYINSQALAQEISNILKGEGWETTMQMISSPMGEHIRLYD